MEASTDVTEGAVNDVGMTGATSDTSVNHKSTGAMISDTGRGKYPTTCTLNVHLVDVLVIFVTFEQV